MLKSSNINRILVGISLPLVTLVTFVFLALTREAFLSNTNLYSLVYGLSFVFFAALGFTYVMAMGEIDLSVGSVFAFSGIFVGYLLSFDIDLYVAIAISLLACLLIGFVNGFLVAKFNTNSLMLTIGTLLLVRGLVGVMSTDLVGGTFARSFRGIARTKYFDVHISIVLMVALLLIFLLWQWKGVGFRRVYLIGEQAKSAAIYGINVAKVKIIVFMFSALAAGVGGIFASSRATHADSRLGIGLEFTVVTAAILGGASLYGGKGNVLMTAIGLFFLALIVNGLTMYDFEPVLQQFVVGALLIVAVVIDRVVNRKNA